LSAAGYRQADSAVNELGRYSVYLYDHARFEWDFVEYRSELNSVLNIYVEAP